MGGFIAPFNLVAHGLRNFVEWYMTWTFIHDLHMIDLTESFDSMHTRKYQNFRMNSDRNNLGCTIKLQ